ncbi:MAG: T9SS type A sorting domain-containing protein [Candidatus Nomurabacteria bacterium]|nr:T9SS type A sorting domain-containing protein [Candidatus Nomurabacteria bacterium]
MKKITILFAMISMIFVKGANAQQIHDLRVESSTPWMYCHEDSIRLASFYTYWFGTNFETSPYVEYKWAELSENRLDTFQMPNQTREIWVKKPGIYVLFAKTALGFWVDGTVSIHDISPKVKVHIEGFSDLLNNHDTLRVCTGASSPNLYGQFKNTDCMTTYVWYNINTGLSEKNYYSVNTPAGSYTLKVVNPNNFGGCTTFSDTITIVEVSPIKPNVIDNNVKENLHCSGQKVMLSVSSNSKFSNIVWRSDDWEIIGRKTDTVFYHPNFSGAKVWIEATDKNGCKAQSDTVIVNTIFVESPMLLNPEKCSLYAKLDVYPVGKFNWYANDTLVSSIDNHLTAKATANYTVTFTNSIGCVSTKSNPIFMDCGPKEDTVANKTTGINEISNKSIEISAYPNPFNDSFTITKQMGSKIVIFDLNGKSVFETLLQSNEEIIKLEIPSGLYILKIYNNDQYIGYKKIIRE